MCENLEMDLVETNKLLKYTRDVTNEIGMKNWSSYLIYLNLTLTYACKI